MQTNSKKYGYIFSMQPLSMHSDYSIDDSSLINISFLLVCESINQLFRRSASSFVNPPISLSIIPSISPSISSSVRHSVRPSASPSVHPSISPFIRTLVRPSVRQSACPSVRLSVRPSVCPSVSPSVRELKTWCVANRRVRLCGNFDRFANLLKCVESLE